MKKVLLVLAIVGITTFAFAGCQSTEQNNSGKINGGEIDNTENVTNNENQNNNDEESGEIIIEPFNDRYAVTESLNTVQDISGLNEATKMSEEDIKAKYNFGKYEALQKEVRVKETEDSYVEIAIIKIGDNDQTEDIISIILKRFKKIEEQYKDNEKILSMVDINNNDNYVLKQQGGIVIGILGENATAIGEALNKTF